MEIVKTLLGEWQEREFPETIIRDFNIDKYISSKLNKIIVLSGFRRVGKTYILLNELKNLLEKKNRKEVIYINFEDERIPLKSEFLSEFFPEIPSLQDHLDVMRRKHSPLQGSGTSAAESCEVRFLKK